MRDVLDVDAASLLQGRGWHAVGNLPYYITTPIVLRLLALQPESMTLMVQSEAAERFFARPKGRVYGPVAIAAQCFYDVCVVCRVSRASFSPQPEVESTVVRLVRNGTRVERPAAFLAFVQAGVFPAPQDAPKRAQARPPSAPPPSRSAAFRRTCARRLCRPETLLRLYRLLADGESY